MKTYDVLVIGAGMGGLASAALWAKKGAKVCVIESHYSSGGCAGYFKRREGFYDVGATTLSGLKAQRPVQKVIEQLNLDLETHHCDPGIVSHFNDKKVHFYANIEKLAIEFEKVFGLQCLDVLLQWQGYETALWKALDIPSNFPNLSMQEFKSFLKKDTRILLKHPSIFFKSFYSFMPKQMRDNEEFIKFVDQLLLISTQQKSRTCPAFMGILGLLYPMDTHSISGGMRALALSLEKAIKDHGGEIYFRNPCQKILRVREGYEVHTKKGVFFTKRLVSNISPELFQSLFEDRSIRQNKGKIWGAMVAYFSINTSNPIEDLFHQVHDEHGSLFFSFSKENGASINQRVTVSSHVEVGEFNDKDEHYQQMKDQFVQRVLKAFKYHFNEYELENIKFDSVGTPLTFKYYTKRPHGEVGGLIHKSVFSLRRLMPNRLKGEQIYFVGDYAFPGQGIVSVFQSALNSVKDIAPN